MNTESNDFPHATHWNFSTNHLILAVIASALMVFAYFDGLERMVYRWGSSEEYGYGYMIPFITAFFIWQKYPELQEMEFTGSRLGVVFVLLGGALLILGELATLFVIVQYAFLVVLFGLVLSYTGWRVFRKLLPALGLLVFMIPLPNFLYQGLSAELQLISSQLGVAFVRMFGISVYLEGNVIDLGVYQLQVVEACSGLRYLFPLAALSYMSAYIYKGEIWKKVVIFLSSAPITVVMNSFRIGVIGVLVEHFGIEQAEGFLHDFEGWIVFMACMVVLIAEMWLLGKVGRVRMSLAQAFEIELPGPAEGEGRERSVPHTLKLSIVILVLTAIASFGLETREELVPERKRFVDFPMKIDSWRGAPRSIELEIIDTLQFDDYLMANYSNTVDGSRHDLNYYVAYYSSQRKGASIHSPRSCIPGGGWEISKHTVTSFDVGDGTLTVNRLLIQKGDFKQLVYYWFDQRGRNLTNEYLVKWYLFWDALTMNRTDGALLRVTSLVDPNQDIDAVETAIRQFIRDTRGITSSYLPE